MRLRERKLKASSTGPGIAIPINDNRPVAFGRSDEIKKKIE
ncbi:hypothetical protein ACSAZL_08060 [Methanosarcina sp. T3]